MGNKRENRLLFRLIRLLSFVALATGGVALPPDVLSGEPIRLLVTFLSLVSASVLPTVSLAIGGMSATGHSVQKISELHQELEGSCRALFSTFGWVAICVALLLTHSILPDLSGAWEFKGTLYTLNDVPRRSVQALVAVCASETLIRAAVIPRVLRAVLLIKRDISVFEARQSLITKAPSDGDMKKIFPKKEGFGTSIILERADQ